jgi:hypothetical protein
VICLLAFGLRVYHLGTQSLWYDEGLSVYLASLPPLATIQTSAITDHPPLHALMLGAWMQVAGQSEFAVRFLSLWWSVLAVALTWRLGREMLTDAIGAIAAVLMATSAFAVWYAQEARGYSLLLALTLITTWAFPRLCHSEPRNGEESYTRKGETLHWPCPTLHRSVGSPLGVTQGDRWAWLVLIVSSVAALYTHYYAAFTLLALNLAFLAVLACRASHASRFTHHAVRNTQHAAFFWLSQLIILAGFAPWLPAAIRQATTNVTYFPGRVGWQTVVGDTLRAFATGDVAPTTIASWAIGAMGVLAVVGAFAEQAGTTRLNRVIPALLVAVPMAAMAIIAWQKPKFAPRYLIEALPAFYLLVGAGLTALRKSAARPRLAMNRHPALAGDSAKPAEAGYAATYQGDLSPFALSARRFTPAPHLRRAAGAGVVGLVMLALIFGAGILLITNTLSLHAMYVDPARQRPDMRSVAAYITANEKPGDVIVLLSGHQLPVFEYYYRGTNPIAPMPDDIMPPAQSPLDYGAARQLEDIAHSHNRLWLVLWQRELADPTDVVTNELLTKARRLGVGRDFHDMRLMLFDLQGHALFGNEPQYAMDIRFVEPIALVGYDLDATTRTPGESLDLALYWRASGRIAGNYQVFTHLLASDGRFINGSDHIAGADNYPTSLWTDGTFIRNTFTLHVPPDAPPGTYAVEVGLYDAQGRLKLTDGTDRILLAEIVVK